MVSYPSVSPEHWTSWGKTYGYCQSKRVENVLWHVWGSLTVIVHPVFFQGGTNYLGKQCQAWKQYSTQTAQHDGTFPHIQSLWLSVGKTMKTSLHIFQDFPLEITQTGHQYTFAQVENNHKVQRLSELPLFQESGSPRSRIPIPQTCRPTKETLLLNNVNKRRRHTSPFISSQEYYVTGENATEGLQ